MYDLISREAAKEAIHDKIVSASTVVRMWDILDGVPAVDAIPVEWLRRQITGGSEMADLIHDGVIRDLIIKWQAEQEASE